MGKILSDHEIEQMDWLTRVNLIRSDPCTTVRHYHQRRKLFQKHVLTHPAQPIGKILDYVYRFETQERGSFHDNGLYFVDKAPNIYQNTGAEISHFVDQYITCSRYYPLVKVQTHRRRKTCYKTGSKYCRFGYPLPPLQETCVLEPLANDVNQARCSVA